MIADSLNNSVKYFSLHKNLRKGFEFITDHIKDNKPVGRYDIEAGEVFALVQAYETVEESQKQWESHEKYIDIQYVAGGVEAIGWGLKADFKLSSEYDPQKDIVFYHGGKAAFINIPAGNFAIFYPNDVHKPGCIWDSSSKVSKIVVKIKV